MKVDLQKINQNVDMEKTAYHVPERVLEAGIATAASGYSLDITGNVTDNMAYREEGLRSLEDFRLAAGRLDVTQQRNYMTVMSNSMSTEDFAKLQKEGYRPGAVAVEDLVTNLDKIKAKVAEAGTVIAGFNDDLSMEEMERITGSREEALKISAALIENDLPVTEENLRNIKEAFEESEQITEVTDSMLRFLVKNPMEPTVGNLYKAQFSSGTEALRPSGGYYPEETNGYYAKKAEQIEWSRIGDSVNRIIEDAGLSGVASAQDEARWTIAQGLPLTRDSLRQVHTYREIRFPLEKAMLLPKFTAAIAVGRKPQQANLTTERQQPPHFASKRMLEETRLMMSIEANRSLARQGLWIDTQELARAVAQLEEAEKELFGRAIDVIQEIAEQPAESIQAAVFDTRSFTPVQLHEIGQSLKQSYDAAMKRYETVWTAPRADLGDSIQKAFRNVDEILADLNRIPDEVNRKTVRILGYTETEITEENFERVREATKAVLEVIERMTPEKMLAMIRDGFNPLNESMTDVADYLKRKTDSERAESYSEYIWKLEKNGEVTPSEKEAYIGICRLIRQIEKNDGRPIGDVLNTEEQLTLQNLLNAVRSRTAAGMDVGIDDAFGTLETLQEKGTSITEQILQAFDQVIRTADTEEAEQLLAKEAKQQSAEAMNVSDEALGALLDTGLPVNADHLLAAQYLMHQRGATFAAFGKLLKRTTAEETREAKEKTEGFVDLLGTEDDPAEAYRSMTVAAESVINEETFREVDPDRLRALRLLHKQLYVAGAMARRETYEVPMEIEGSLTGIHLRILRGTETAEAAISFETEGYGSVRARFSLHQEKVNGYVTGDSEEGIRKLSEQKAAFTELAGYDTEAVRYFVTKDLKPDRATQTDQGNKASVRALYGVVRAFLKSL